MAASLRFALGDRVSCNVGSGWKEGVVVAHDYREEDWPPDDTAPYQVELDDGRLIYAPLDTPELIRAAAALRLASFAPGDPSAALKAVEEELSAIRELPFVAAVGQPRLLGIAADEGELRTPTPDSGPWYLPVAVTGPEGGAYDAAYRVNIKFNAAWPRSAAEVLFCGVVHHPLLDGNTVDAAALRALVRSPQSGEGRLCQVLRAVNELLHEDGPSANAKHNRARLDVISRYRPLRRHDRMYTVWEEGWPQGWLDPALRRAMEQQSDDAWRSLVTEEGPEVYSFNLFTPEFCDTFVEELRSFYASKLPARRPNSMNNYGVVINDIGMESFIDRLQADVFAPLSRVFFAEAGAHLDGHHSFIVRYKVGEDLGLDMHTDDSDVTFNCCLVKDFQGAGLQFCGRLGSSHHRRASLLYKHVQAKCVFHLGTRRHGADDITCGERLNLIVWNTGSEYRRSKLHHRRTHTGPHFEREVGKPDPVCLSYTHDRDYGVFKEYCEKTEEYAGYGWCPPRSAEYDGFTAEAKP
eukprot:TRINITY_DN32364_c0_g1_i1.p1 TRINITY_DN32364_c0_g1~~TRINITY_DN32364_c0_g1_i1.p1  ORF type:complete len:544 (+),score=197.99 TRINITY_DN32364_c0_g1_i1:66-1634(+)